MFFRPKSMESAGGRLKKQDRRGEPFSKPQRSPPGIMHLLLGLFYTAEPASSVLLPLRLSHLMVAAPNAILGSHKTISGKKMHMKRASHCRQMNGTTPL